MSVSADLPVLRIFLSSPGDVSEERALAHLVIRRLASEVADFAQLAVVDWEHEPIFGHATFQAQIERPSSCDLVVSILWSRLGTRLPSDYAPAPGVPPPTGTEFELQDAMASYRALGKPNLLIYRKTPGPEIRLGSTDFAQRERQYEMLADFCRRAFYDEQGAILVAHHTFANSSEFERRLAIHVREWLSRQLTQQAVDVARLVWRKGDPYRGLEAFDAEHQAVYFGRSQAISELIHRIRDTEAAAKAESRARLILVHGMSGTGKTSLFHAGVFPFLALRPVEGIASWLTLSVRASESDPQSREAGCLAVLAARLCESLPALARVADPVAKLTGALLTRPEGAAERIEDALAAAAVEQHLTPGRVRLVIYVDQLEENFSSSVPSVAATSLFDAIVALSRSGSIWIAASMRSDFMHRLEALAGVIDCLARNPPYTLLPPRPDEMAEIIEESARAAGLVWEQRDGISLGQALLRDAVANPEALPLLQYTLSALYAQREGRLLRWSSYEGGLKTALTTTAEGIVMSLGAGAELTFSSVMRELVSVAKDGAAVRRYASTARFAEGSDARAFLDRLVAHRLCVTTDEGHGDGPVAYLAHESLIHSWPRAKSWLQRETQLLQMRDDVWRDIEQWIDHDRNDAWLATEPEKLAVLREIEAAGLMPVGDAQLFAMRSKQRFASRVTNRRIAIASICAFAVLAAVGWLRADQQKTLAEQEFATADQTKRFLIDLFDSADPAVNRGEKVTVSEALKRGEQKIDRNLQEEPAIRAELLTTIAQSYLGLGEYEPAERLAARAVADQKVALAADHESVSDESRVRTLVVAGSAQYLAAHYPQAIETLRPAVELARASLQPSSFARSQALTTLADALMAEQGGKAATEAIELCLEALSADRARAPTPEARAILAGTLSSLGTTYFYADQLTVAEAPLREALAIRLEVLDKNHPRTAESLTNLGALLYQRGAYADSIEIYEQTRPVYQALYGTAHPELATLINNLGRSKLIAGDVDGAEPLIREALAMTEHFTGPEHDHLVSPLNSLAMIHLYRKEWDAAWNDIDRAEKIARNDGELLDQVLVTAADIELARGDLAQSAKLLAEAKTLLEASYKDRVTNAWRYAVWNAVAAQQRAAEGDVSGARMQLAEAAETIRKRFGERGLYSILAERRAQKLGS